MQKQQYYYKILLASGRAPISLAQWSLPIRLSKRGPAKPGMWHTVIGTMEACHNGLHVVRTPEQIRHWLRLEWGRTRTTRRLFLAEVSGKVVQSGHGTYGKCIVRSARLVREIRKGTREWDIIVHAYPYGIG